MSITFFVAGQDSDADINLSNVNAWALLEWIGITPDHDGSIPARELAALTRRRLWPELRARGDEGIAPIVDTTRGGATFVDCGRRAGYFQERASQLLQLADMAGDGTIAWG
jgi:hypothetical protein